MNTQQSLSSLLSLATVLTLAPALVACDGVEVDGELIDELDDGVEMRSGAAVQSTKWRIRNAAPQQNSGQWVLREMDFCADPECTQPLNGLAIDSGASKSWSAPANAFDNNTSTLWKTFDASVAGQSWIGLEFPQPVAVGGIYLKTDNVVYSVGAIFVEYWDANTNTWVTADFIGKLPAGAELHRDVEIRDTFPIKWRIRNAAAQGNSGQIVLREMDFCADADCATPLTDGTAIDSGASMANCDTPFELRINGAEPDRDRPMCWTVACCALIRRPVSAPTRQVRRIRLLFRERIPPNEPVHSDAALRESPVRE